MVQPFENQVSCFWGNAPAGVGDRNVNKVVIRFDQASLHHDGAFRRRKFDRVFDEIEQGLQSSIWVGVNHGNPGVDSRFQSDPLFLCGGFHHGNRLLNHVGCHQATGLDADFAGLGASGFQQVADHAAKLLGATQHGFQVFALFGVEFASQPVEQNSRELINRGQGCAQFMRNMRQELIFELQLLAAAHIKRGDQSLAFHGVAQSARQLLAVKIAFDEVILHALVYRFERKFLVILPGQHDHRHAWRLAQYLAESICPVTVRKVQIQEHDRWLLLAQAGETSGKPVHAADVYIRPAFD